MNQTLQDGFIRFCLVRRTSLRTIGAVVANEDELKNATKKNDDVIKRLGDLIDKMDSFASRALKIKKALSTPIKYVLEKLSDPEKGSDDENDDET